MGAQIGPWKREGALQGQARQHHNLFRRTNMPQGAQSLPPGHWMIVCYRRLLVATMATCTQQPPQELKFVYISGRPAGGDWALETGRGRPTHVQHHNLFCRANMAQGAQSLPLGRRHSMIAYYRRLLAATTQQPPWELQFV